MTIMAKKTDDASPGLAPITANVETTSTSPATTPQKPAAPATKRIANKELQAMAAIDEILEAMEGDQVVRVLSWLLSRYATGKFRITIGTDDVTGPADSPNARPG